jgi:hypothetical protein
MSAVASQIVPHDEGNLLFAPDDGTHYGLYASTRDGAPDLACREDHCVLREPATARLIGEVPGPARDPSSGICGLSSSATRTLPRRA